MPMYNLCAEGTSTTFGNIATNNISYVQRYANLFVGSITFHSEAVSGTLLTDMLARAATVDGRLVNGAVNILTVQGMQNNMLFGDTAQNAADAITYRNYLQARREARWYVIVLTNLPRGTDAVFDAARNILNPIIRTWVGSYVDAVWDNAADSRIGPLANASDPTKYASGDIHPLEYTHQVMYTIGKPILDAVFMTGRDRRLVKVGLHSSDSLLLSGDMQNSTDMLLLSGDMQSATDVLSLNGES